MPSSRLQWLALPLLVAALAATSADAARAQTAGGAASVASGAADLDATERRLYDASRRAPRDPGARAALGEWLAARGQLKSGTVLLEEARLFGGNGAVLAARLRPVYAWLRDWASLAALPAPPLTPGELARASLLAERGTTVEGAESTAVPFAPLEVGALGRVPLVLGADTLWGEVDPQEEGLVLPGLGRGAGLVEVTGDDRRGALGIVRECALGGLTMRNVPMRLDASLGAGRARIGFDVFAQLAPTVDARAGVVTFRRAGRVVEPAGAAAIPFLLGFPGVRLALRAGDAPAPIASPAGRAALRGHAWTVDVRRGVIWVDGAR
jgi:hypothetical protein